VTVPEQRPAERAVRRSDDHYTPIASAYVTSAIHSQGRDLARMVELAGLLPGARLLDVGTGTGHTALAFARGGADVVGLDMTQAMLAQAQALAAERGTRLDAVRSYAESLPFPAGAFDAVACRYCAHHFRDNPLAIREMGRVLRPGGRLIFVDHVAPEDDEADAFVNRLDWLRDPSHNREPRLSEYERWFADAGLTIDAIEPFREPMVADEWFARARTSPDREAEARAMLAGAGPRLRDIFTISDDPVSFELQMVIVVASRVGHGIS
jgi:ubiquinone/menaquinone biosynthesis C-methylase UbiE